MRFSNIWRFIFSYIEFTSDKGFFERFLNLCAHYGVKIYSPQIKNGTLTGSMSASDYRYILPLARKAQVKLKICRKRGLRYTAIKYKKRVGLAVGAVIFITILNVLSLFVWNVNIVGSDDLPRDEILKSLQNQGVFEGCLQSELTAENAKQIRNNLLNEIDELSWGTLNLNGCILEVECRMKADVPKEIEYTPSNIIADKGGRIISVKAYGGTPCVKSGQAVTKGQLLVSGTVDLTNNTTMFCRSNAEIYAEVENPLEVFVPFSQESKTTLDDCQTRSVLTFFRLKIPLFFGEITYEYKAQQQTFTPVFNEVRLPVTLTSKTFYKVQTTRYTIDENEAVSRAKTELEKTAKERFSDSILSASEPVISIENDGVKITAKYLCKEKIGKEEKILINP